MAFERIKARLAQLRRGVPQSAISAAAREVKAVYLVDSVSKRGNTPYTPTDVQVRADSLGLTVTAPEWSMRIARWYGQPAKWRDIFAARVRDAMKGGA